MTSDDETVTEDDDINTSLALPSRAPADYNTPVSRNRSEFHYSELKDREFRLIHVLPGNTETIECNIIHESFDSNPEYTALSYAWGDVDDRVDITVHGHRFSVTASLYAALRVLRNEYKAIVLWADALSIDQENKEEQSLQVQLMTDIYSQAESVVVWLGEEGQNGALALDLLDRIQGSSPKAVERLIDDESKLPEFDALVALFEREYWRRLWVVQEVLNAKSVVVYCGNQKRPWDVYVAATETFKENAEPLAARFWGGAINAPRYASLKHRLPYPAVLSSQGPESLENLRPWRYEGPEALLEVLHHCRHKLASDPRDKLFGVLGILPDQVRLSFEPDYHSSLRTVYTGVVKFLLHETRRFDVVCEAIYFPPYTNNASLPSWVPDWSHDPQVGALCLSYNFSASRDGMVDRQTEVKFKLVDPLWMKLEISAIDLGHISVRTIAVGTLCGLDDSLMAFLHWHSKFLEHYNFDNTSGARRLHKAFCRTLCLGQKTKWRSSKWVTICYHAFGSLIRERLPSLPLNTHLRWYADLAEEQVDVKKEDRRRILEDNCSRRMMSRCFFITKEGLMGMGTGFMDPNDVVCVPLGSSTPILLRPEGDSGEYRYVGDVYVEGYMHGKAIEDWHNKDRVKRKYVLH